MTNALSRLLALPFALALIFAFTSGGLDFTGPKTYLILLSLIVLALLYVFKQEIDTWWWKRKAPSLDRPLKAWIAQYSSFYKSLEAKDREIFEKKISSFMHIKSFTLRAERNYELEEDIKAIIAHEYMRITLHKQDFYYDDFDQFVVYNHAFASPENETLHTLEVYHPDKVVILSKEQLLNGFFQLDRFVNVALLSAIIVFVRIFPRLEYPAVSDLDPEDICAAHGINLNPIKAALGLDWINRLELLIFCYWLKPEKTALYNPDFFNKLQSIFPSIQIQANTFLRP